MTPRWEVSTGWSWGKQDPALHLARCQEACRGLMRLCRFYFQLWIWAMESLFKFSRLKLGSINTHFRVVRINICKYLELSIASAISLSRPSTCCFISSKSQQAVLSLITATENSSHSQIYYPLAPNTICETLSGHSTQFGQTHHPNPNTHFP